MTAVGGTNIGLDPQNKLVSEVAWNDQPDAFAAGGGGVSVLSDRPWWQRSGLTRSAVGDARTSAPATTISGR